MQDERDRLSHPGKRSEGRLRLRLRAEAVSLGGRARVVLYDLSAGGAKIFAGSQPLGGGELLLKWAGFEAFGRVVWHRDRFHGIQFDEPVSTATIVGTRQVQDLRGMTQAEVAQWTAKTGWDFGKSLI